MANVNHKNQKKEIPKKDERTIRIREENPKIIIKK